MFWFTRRLAQSNDPIKRSAAIRKLYLDPSERADELLASFLEDKEPYLRFEAARYLRVRAWGKCPERQKQLARILGDFMTLARLGEVDEAFDGLVAILAREPGTPVGVSVAQALSEFGARAIPPLARVVKENSGAGAVAAIKSIAVITEPDSLPLLSEATLSKNGDVARITQRLSIGDRMDAR